MRKMKDSGIEWIGEIPENWDTIRVKHLATEKDTLFLDGDWINSDVIVDEGIRYLTSGNVGEGVYKEQGKGYISEETFNKLNCLTVYPGDLMISRLNEPVGRCCIVPEGEEYYVVAVDNVILRPNHNFHKKYLLYCMNTTGYARAALMAASGTTMQRVSRTSLGNMAVPVASYEEQFLIADYLDKKCAEIDAIIAAKEKTNELLKERRQSIIYEAVTKGLDPTVPMKDSGIEWIGEIPESWSVCKTLYGLSMPITDGPHETPELLDEGIPFVSAEAVSSGNGKIDFDHIRGYISKDYYQECCKKYTPAMNDIYMIKSGATTGKVALVDTDRIFTIWSPLAVFRCNEKKCFYKYLYYVLQSDSYQKQLENNWSFGTQQNIGMRTLEKLIICYPNIDEQKCIATHLDQKCTEIDGLIAANNFTIKKLKEYRQSVIYEAVTGKVEI